MGESMSSSAYPLRVDATLDPNVSRWLWLVKWLLAIPYAGARCRPNQV